jgi:hypothetical protein
MVGLTLLGAVHSLLRAIVTSDTMSALMDGTSLRPTRAS